MRPLCLNGITFVFVGFMFIVPSKARAQASAPLQPLRTHPATSWNGAANRWRLTAVSLRSQVDTAPASIRSQRNHHWQTSLQKIPAGFVGLATIAAGPHPEFNVQPGDVWATATFETFHVFPADADLKYIYTEMNFRVEHLFRAPPGSNLDTGSTVDVDIPGGRLKMTDGHIITSGDLRPRQYSLQPGHKYLIQLLYEPDGNFFYPGQYWDITSGKVVVEGSQTGKSESQQKSLIAGMSVPTLLEQFPSILSAESPKR